MAEAAEKAEKDYGYGLASVRFICGTQEIHKEREQKIAKFLGSDDSILYSSCFDANGRVFAVEGGLARFVPAEAGMIGGLEIEVKGLAEGRELVAGPGQVLRDLQDGAPVKPARGAKADR